MLIRTIALFAITLFSQIGTVSRAQEPEIGPIGASLAESVGINQNVVVVMCEYLGDETPFTRPDASAPGGQITIEDAEQFVEVMEGPVNAYFLDATRQPTSGDALTSFQFIPVPGKCQLDFENDGTVDDPEVVMNEFPQGAAFADEALPGVFDTTSRVIVVVNGDKRARAGWAHWPFVLPNSGLRMLRFAIIGTKEVAEADFSTLAHELGHQLGLPDLYQLDGEPGRLVGQWGLMGQDRMQHFTAYSRYMANWIENPPARVVTITPSTVPAGPIRLDLPGNNNGNPELIRIDASSMEASPLPSPISDAIGLFVPFIGYYVEFRNPAATPLDTPIATSGYNPGMLVFRHTDWLNTETGFSPRPLTLQHPTQPTPILTPASAPFPPNTPFVDPAMGLTVTNLGANADGSINVRITWAPPPRPDLVITDLMLDSPVNGLGTVIAPALFGDPVMSTVTMSLTSLPPTMTAATPPHSMRISLRNLGNAPNPAGMTGRLWLLEPSLPIPFDLTNPASLLPFRFAELPFIIPVMPPGGTSAVTVSVTPTNSFLAVAFVDINSAETDLQLLNNAYAEPFFEVQTLSFASPYPPLKITQTVTNIDDEDHVIGFSINLPTPFSQGWSLSEMNNARMSLDAGERDAFHIAFEPPSPGRAKPGQLGSLATTAWMDEGDSFIPVMNLPHHYMLTATTALDLTVKGEDTKYEFRGQLVQIENGAAVDQLVGQRVNLTVSRSAGPDITLMAETGNQGLFFAPFTVEAIEEVHAVVAQFPGTLQFGEAVSEPVVFYEPEAPLPMLGDFSFVWRGDSLFLFANLTREALTPLQLTVTSSDPAIAKAPPIRIDAGARSGQTEVAFARGARLTRSLTFSVSHSGQSRKTVVPGVRPGLFRGLIPAP